VETVEIDEYHLFNALAKSYNRKILRDLSYLRGRILEMTGGEEQVNESVVNKIFYNERERYILFTRVDDYSVTNILRRVLRYLEGDIIVKTERTSYRASISA
jgi:hypothetical protein